VDHSPLSKRPDGDLAYAELLTDGKKILRRQKACPSFLQNCLRRQTGNRHAEWRSTDIVEPNLLTERDRSRITAVLSADAQLDIGKCRTPALNSKPGSKTTNHPAASLSFWA